MHVLDLPTELLGEIGGRVRRYDILAVALCCKDFRATYDKRFFTTVCSNNLCSFQWALANGFSLTVHSFAACCAHGCVDVLRYIASRLCLRKCRHWTAFVKDAAEHAATADVLDYLEAECGLSFASSQEWTRNLLMEAASHHRVDALRWLRGRGCWEWHWESELPNGDLVAHSMGHMCICVCHVEEPFRKRMQLLEWMLDEGYGWGEFDAEIVEEASRCKAWDAVERLVKRGCPRDGGAYAGVYSTGGKWDAERAGWLFQLGCPLTAYNVYRDAACSGSVDALAWLLSHGCELHLGLVRRAVRAASTRGHIAALEWFRRQGVPLGTMGIATAAAASAGQLATLKWLVSHGCPLHVKTGDMEDQTGWFDVDQGQICAVYAHYSLCELAARGLHCTGSDDDDDGTLSVLEWLVEMDQPLDALECLRALQSWPPREASRSGRRVKVWLLTMLFGLDAAV